MPATVDNDLLARYREVRGRTESLRAPLSDEDCVVQSMPDVSPAKWHLAHVTWFFETFLLEPFEPGYESPDSYYSFLFNSYYNAVGAQYSRPDRGLLTRPSMDEVVAYRAHVDASMERLLERRGREPEIAARAVLGLNHEQQHQELLLMDIKHVFSRNPLRPTYRSPECPAKAALAPELGWIAYDGGLLEFGHEGAGFSYDNEGPRHRRWLEPFEIGTRLVTNGEYLQFVEDGGYDEPRWWLSDGWSVVRNDGWRAPLYWLHEDGQRLEHALCGTHPLDLASPVCHVSFYEAAAYATWAGARLPTEFEWEVVASRAAIREGRFVESGQWHPQPARGEGDGPSQIYGDLWEWTASPYSAYPGYRAPEGAIGEYNGKFMCNQQVLRGGSCITPRSHVRRTYRNFFYPHQRWAFTGIRLAREAGPAPAW